MTQCWVKSGKLADNMLVDGVVGIVDACSKNLKLMLQITLVVMLTLLRRRLVLTNPAGHYEYYMLELLGHG